MKKIVIVFGLISGLIITTMMIISISIINKNSDFEGSEVIGFSTMIVAFSFIFVGIKNFRDKHNNGMINFGKAFKIGLFISLIASTMYVVSWLINYYYFIPDFMDKYSTHLIEKTKASGASQIEIDKKITEMDSFKEMYKNPVMVVLFTYMEVLPIGLLISLISAWILRRKEKDPGVSMAG